MPHQQAVNILRTWMAETVRPVPARDIPHEAERLAGEFTAYAEDAGLHLHRLEEDLGDTLVNVMAEKLRQKTLLSGADPDEA